jgi:hypothetical protein
MLSKPTTRMESALPAGLSAARAPMAMLSFAKEESLQVGVLADQRRHDLVRLRGLPARGLGRGDESDCTVTSL